MCENLSLKIEAGERWCILGRNGSGKTTLLHTLAGLRAANAGTVSLADEPLGQLTGKKRAQGIGLLFQDHHDAFPSTVLETALVGRHPWLGPFQWESTEDRERALEALQEVGPAELEQRMTNTLSGGERRRLGIATLLTQNPDIFLLDEPTNHLDLHHQVHTLELLRQLAIQYQRSMCMSLHDVNLAVRYCNRFLLLFGGGETAQGESNEVLTPTNLERLYQHPLRFIDTPDGPVWMPL